MGNGKRETVFFNCSVFLPFPAAPLLLPYSPENGSETVSIGGGFTTSRFRPHQSAAKATAIEFSFSRVEVIRKARSEFDSYTMSHFPHGFCVIINNELFKDHSEREGSLVDEHNLTQCFRYLGYTVEVHRNLSAYQIQEIFSYYQKLDHSFCDSFIVCILSHGEEGFIFGTDSKTVSLGSLSGKLDATSCRTLANKPKMFFVQACRGSNRSERSRIASDSGTQQEAVFRSSDAVRADSVASALSIPEDADFFFGYASPPGKVSWRDTEHGSWYVSELCRAFSSHATYADLDTMVTMAHNEVGTGYENGSYKQAPEKTSRLRKKVHFF